MYNWIENKKFSDSRNFGLFGLPPKSSNVNSMLKVRNNSLNSFSPLPVIKEEEGFNNEDEREIRNYTFSSFDIKEGYGNRKSVEVLGSSLPKSTIRKTENCKRYDKLESITKLPPLVNINCMLNVNMKQLQRIWDTEFGKRLIYGRDTYIKVNSPNFKENCTDPPEIKTNGKYGDGQSNGSLRNKSFTGNKNIKDGGKNPSGRFCDQTKPKNNKRKLKRIKKDNRGFPKTQNHNNKVANDNVLKTASKSKSLTTKGEKTSEEYFQAWTETPTVSSFSKNQHFLSECVKSILDSVSNKVTCEHCEEVFPNVEELVEHNRRHEKEKEVCLLCDKVFYKANDFVQHLLTHEGVDRFSCKTCKKYFPSLRKYKKHYIEFHHIPSDDVTEYRTNDESADHANRWLFKYECKRCKKEFDSEEAYREHKRNHTKMDVMGVYLLNTRHLQKLV